MVTILALARQQTSTAEASWNSVTRTQKLAKVFVSPPAWLKTATKKTEIKGALCSFGEEILIKICYAKKKKKNSV